MRWHPDRLLRVLTTPYVPTLGPVHPQALTPALFDAVAAIATTGRFLPHDPDQRWSATKDEHLLTDRIHQDDAQTILPTLRRRAGGVVTVYLYRSSPPDLPATRHTVTALRGTYHAVMGQIVWFSPDPPDLAPGLACTRLLLKVFSPADVAGTRSPVVDLDACDPATQASFAGFATAMATDGLAFLYQRWRAGALDGPILVVVADRQVVGAIGPLRILPDPLGTPRLLPQYLGVLPTHRSRGHGRALWRAAADWGQRHGATYQLLQATVGGASDRLFAGEGLRPLGLVCRMTA